MEDKKVKNPLLTILVVIITILAFSLLFKQFEIQREAEKLFEQPSSAPQGTVTSPYFPKAKENFTVVEYPFGRFTANLARPSGPQRFLKVTMVLLVETPTNDKLKEIINNTPTLRDEIINIFNSTTPRDILKLEGREVMKNLILQHINNKLKTETIKGILFTQFVVN